MLLRDMSTWIENVEKSSGGPQQMQLAPLHLPHAVWIRWPEQYKRAELLEDMNASQRHKLRIQSEQFRYALEVLGQLLQVSPTRE